jgi:hypothetical protein
MSSGTMELPQTLNHPAGTFPGCVLLKRWSRLGGSSSDAGGLLPIALQEPSANTILLCADMCTGSLLSAAREKRKPWNVAGEQQQSTQDWKLGQHFAVTTQPVKKHCQSMHE